MPLQDNLNMYKKILIILTALVILTGVYYYFRPMQTRVIIGDNTFYVDVAVTNKEKELGLGNRDSLAPDRGMVFVYDHDEQYRFWMKNMRFPIDILWIKGNIIVDITKNIPIPSGSDLPVYFPEVPVNIVLELPAGTVDTYGITTGSTATFRN
jgi:uncharacterized membrane protein (UPF0127 family)